VLASIVSLRAGSGDAGERKREEKREGHDMRVRYLAAALVAAATNNIRHNSKIAVAPWTRARRNVTTQSNKQE